MTALRMSIPKIRDVGVNRVISDNASGDKNIVLHNYYKSFLNYIKATVKLFFSF